MKHDYEAALKFIAHKDGQDCIETEEYYHIFKYHGDTIRHAIAMMSKLQEPSDGMIMAGIKAWNGGAFAVVTQFKAMLEQAEKEIDG